MATFVFGHCPDDGNHDGLIEVVNDRVGIDIDALGDERDIECCVVLAGGCPSGHNLSDGVGLVPANVASEDAERSPEPIGDVDELFKFGVGWVLHFTQPGITNPNIKRIIVANPPWNSYRLL